MIVSFGKVTVANPGTPVRATANRGVPTERVPCHAFMFECLPNNVGRAYVGAKGMNKTTLAGVYAILPAPTTNTIPTYSGTLEYAPAAFNMADMWIDADNAGEGVLPTAVVG